MFWHSLVCVGRLDSTWSLVIICHALVCWCVGDLFSAFKPWSASGSPVFFAGSSARSDGDEMLIKLICFMRQSNC